jgi:hypothetical protein
MNAFRIDSRLLLSGGVIEPRCSGTSGFDNPLLSKKDCW